MQKFGSFYSRIEQILAKNTDEMENYARKKPNFLKQDSTP